MFEPKPISELDMKRGLIWANCISNVSAERVVIVSVINSSDSEITLEETDNDMGTVSTSSAFSIESNSEERETGEKARWRAVEIYPSLEPAKSEELMHLLVKYEDIFQSSSS